MIVEEIAAKFGLEVDAAAFAKVEHALHALHHGVTALAGVFGAAIVVMAGIVESVGEAGDHAARMAEKVGISTQALQGLEFAAHLADVSAESLQGGLKFLGKNAVEAAHGSDEMAKAFRQAGVEVKDAHGKVKPIEELLEGVSEHFKEMPAGAEKTALAIKLFGRAGIDMIPLLNKGKEKIGELRAEAEELGLVMSKETIKDAEEYADQLKIVGASLTGLRNALGAPLLKQFAAAMKAISHWIKTNREAIAAPIVKFFKTLGDVIEWLGGKTAGAEFVLGALKTGLIATGVVAAALGVEMVAAGIAAGAAWLLAAAPVIALGAAIGLIADDLYVFSQGGDSLLGRLLKWFDKIDPNDNPLIMSFKMILKAMTDLGDPHAWDNFITGFMLATDALKVALLDMLISVAKSAGELFVKGMVGNLSGALNAADFLKESALPAAVNTATMPLSAIDGISRISNGLSSARQGSIIGQMYTPGPASSNKTSNNNQTTINAPIVVNTQPGADAPEIAGQTGAAVQKQLREAHAALKGG